MGGKACGFDASHYQKLGAFGCEKRRAGLLAGYGCVKVGLVISDHFVTSVMLVVFLLTYNKGDLWLPHKGHPCLFIRDLLQAPCFFISLSTTFTKTFR